MGKISDMLTAAKSDGNRVGGLVTVSDVDSKEGVKGITSLVRWTYGKCYSGFDEKCKDEVNDEFLAIVRSNLWSEFMGRLKRVPTLAERLTIDTVIQWTWSKACGSKGKLRLAYVAEPGSLTAEEEVDAIMGKSWNTVISSDYAGDSYAVDTPSGVRKVDILSKSLTDYEVFLTTTKER